MKKQIKFTIESTYLLNLEEVNMDDGELVNTFVNGGLEGSEALLINTSGPTKIEVHSYTEKQSKQFTQEDLENFEKIVADVSVSFPDDDYAPEDTEDNSFRVNKETRQDRYNTCKGCDRFFKPTTTCKECGCFMAIKTWISEVSCPLGKW